MLRAAVVLAGLSLALSAAGSAAVQAGGKIAFSAGAIPAGGGMITSQIYLANADGSGRTKLTNGGDNSYPALSPDGTKIAFTSDRAGDYALFVMGVDGSGVTQLTQGLGASSPDWSPDGDTIAFTAGHGETHDVYTVPAAGGTAKLVQRNAIGPAWSADGSRLAFSSDSDNRLYWSSGAAGARHRVIARSGLGYEQSPSWSPDGKRLVFTGDVADRPQVYVVGIDGSGLKKLTSGASSASYPHFSADGSRIVYGDGGKLLQMSAGGGSASTLTTIGGQITGISLQGKASTPKPPPTPTTTTTKQTTTTKAAPQGTGLHHCTIAPKRPASIPNDKTFGFGGTPGADVMCGTAGNDHIAGFDGNDVIWGGAGDDGLNGGRGRDVLHGEAGNDLLFINAKDGERDVLDGGPGTDCVWNYDEGIDVLVSIEQVRENGVCVPLKK